MRTWVFQIGFNFIDIYPSSGSTVRVSVSRSITINLFMHAEAIKIRQGARKEKRAESSIILLFADDKEGSEHAFIARLYILLYTEHYNIETAAQLNFILSAMCVC
jgi:hypothetical protein